jgi:hypothetical protein
MGLNGKGAAVGASCRWCDPLGVDVTDFDGKSVSIGGVESAFTIRAPAHAVITPGGDSGSLVIDAGGGNAPVAEIVAKVDRFRNRRLAGDGRLGGVIGEALKSVVTRLAVRHAARRAAATPRASRHTGAGRGRGR